MSSALTNTTWSLPKKLSFRFFFILLLLLIFLNNNGAFLYAGQIFSYPTTLLQQFIPWFAVNVLGHNYDFTIFTNGSGDTTYDYIKLLFFVIVAVLGTLLWTVLDRKRENYNQLYYWLLLFVRYYLAFTLTLYGSVKIIQLQFPQPQLSRLLQSFGDASPMGLAWTFLGFSKGYNVFMGIIEVSSVLLLFRRTMIIGAFLSLAASVHVMAMNYFFDVPVKILSTTLVVMCLFILAPYMLSIGRFFLTNQPQQLTPHTTPTFGKRWQFITFRSLKYLFIVWTIGIMFTSALQRQYTYGALAPKPPLYGIYNVKKFLLNGKEIPPLTTDSVRWHQLVIEWQEFARVKFMDDKLEHFKIKVDVKQNEIEMEQQENLAAHYKFKYNLTNDSTLTLNGLKDQDSLSITFRKFDLRKFRLMNRGFHWINEYPYNR